MSDTPEILPDSRMPTVVTARGAVNSKLGWWQPIYCANCGKPGGFVPEENMTYAFYLCDDPCATQYGEIASTMCIPDDVFYAKVAELQTEKYGRMLSPVEMVSELDNPDSSLSRMAQQRSSITPKGE